MSGWAQTRKTQTSETGQEGNAPSGSRSSGGAGNAAKMEKLFAEQNYKILDKRKTNRAISRNNANHLGDLPRILQAFHLSARDEYDAEVVSRIAEFQQNFFRRENAHGVDGIVGRTTLRLLSSYYDTQDAGEVDTEALWPKPGASTVEQYEHYAHLASLFGNAPKDGEPMLIGIRGVMEFAEASHSIKSINAYDDTYVLLFKTDDGVGVWSFAGATHAYQATFGGAPNADAKGAPDVGTIRPTHNGESYTLKRRGLTHGHTSMGVSSDPTQWGADAKPSWWELGMVPVERDTNQNRKHEAEEATASANRTVESKKGFDKKRQVLNGLGDYGTVTWFHPGFTTNTNTGRRFSSVACLTARQEDIDNVIGISKVGKSDIRLIIIEAPEAMKRLGRAPKGKSQDASGKGATP